MANLGCQRRGDKLMVHRLVTDLFKVLPRETVFDQTAGRVRMADDAVNLVEGQPVFHLAPVPVEQHLTVVHIGIIPCGGPSSRRIF